MAGKTVFLERYTRSLVRCSHGLNVPILLGLILSGISIYWASPVYLAGLLSVLTGWAIHKPMQLYWLTWIFGGYDKARIWHFWLMWIFVLFVVPHVILVFADGWDTLRSMIVGWSTKTKRSEGFDNEP